MFETKSKEELFKTAYSILDKKYVKLVHAHKDDLGQWIFTCLLDGQEILYRESELTNFVL